MTNKFRSNSAIHLGGLIIIWILAIITVNPLREFPLNDDFLYVKSAMELSGQGRFVINTWVAVTIIIHILWGSLFVSVFGSSFSILRISMLVMGLAGVMVSYKVLNEVLKQRTTAFLLTLFIAFNPVFFNLSFTFMTDLTFFSMVVCSVLFYILSFQEKKGKYIYLATFFSLLATLTRQVGLFVPLSALVVVVISERKLLSKNVMTYFLHAFFITAVLVAYYYWLRMTGRQGEGYRDISAVIEDKNFIMVILQRMVDHSGRWLAETGLWFLPLTVFFTIQSWKLFRRYLLPAGIITVLLSVTVILQTSHFPGGNIFYVLGLGPRTLMDAYILGMKENTEFLAFMAVLLKALALTGGVLVIWLMVANAFEAFNRVWRKPDQLVLVKLFSLILIMVYQAVFLASFTYFDRYAIPLFLPVLILIIPPFQGTIKLKPNSFVPVLVFLLLLVIFSVSATRDYLSWNEARWDAASKLVKEGVEPSHIDGGLEYIGWQGKTFIQYGQWKPGSYDYALTFQPVDGYRVVGKEPYQNLVPYSRGYIYILKKE